jgi:hypothetical protein
MFHKTIDAINWRVTVGERQWGRAVQKIDRLMFALAREKAGKTLPHAIKGVEVLRAEIKAQKAIVERWAALLPPREERVREQLVEIEMGRTYQLDEDGEPTLVEIGLRKMEPLVRSAEHQANRTDTVYLHSKFFGLAPAKRDPSKALVEWQKKQKAAIDDIDSLLRENAAISSQIGTVGNALENAVRNERPKAEAEARATYAELRARADKVMRKIRTAAAKHVVPLFHEDDLKDWGLL